MGDLSLRVDDWASKFETHESRRCRELVWVRMPTATDADGLVELLAHDSGAAHFGCWCLLVRIAARCKPRGVLMRDSGRPHTAQSLALLSRIPAEIWEQAIPRFVEIGWLSYAEPQTDHASITVDAGPRVIEACAARGMTHDRKERKKEESIPQPAVGVDAVETSTGITDKPQDASERFALEPQAPDAESERSRWFEEFWRQYWRRVGKIEARRAFEKLVASRATFEAVLAGIAAQTPMMSARERDKIPHPATWLRGQRWRDEIEADKPTAAARAYKHAWEADR